MHVSNYNMVFDINQPGRKNEKILYNQLARSLDVVSSEVVKLLELLGKEERVGDFARNKLGYLFERGYCYHDKKEEDKKIESEYKKARERHGAHPVTFIITPTYACNLRCNYCFQQYMDMQYKPNLMTPEMVEKAVEFITNQVVEPGEAIVPVIYLFGGEPLMLAKGYREITEMVIDKCKLMQIPTAVVSNGVYLKQYVEKFEGVNVFEIKITFNGCKRVHDKVRVRANGTGTYDEIMDGLQAAIDKGFPITINCVGTRDMYRSLHELVEDFDKKGWLDLPRDKFQFQSEHECSDLFQGDFESMAAQKRAKKGKDAESPLREKYEDVRSDTLRLLVDVGNTNSKTQKFILPDCRGIRYIFDNGLVPPPSFFCPTSHLTWSMDVNGNLFVCIGSTGDQGGKVGTFYPEIKFDEEQLTRWRDHKNIFDIEKCRDCKVRFTCGSGCARLKVPSNPDDPTCEPIQDILQIGFDYYFPRIEEKWLNGSANKLIS